jgi:2-keto-4-pentenoate hydratase/2-oxohepta-3-ene-1,7-dioic acid hydratase in catechol pathway
MRLATFVARGQERIGFVLGECVYGLLETQKAVAGLRIGGPQPEFLDGHSFPETMEGLLALGQRGLDAARRVEDFCRTFVDQGRDPFELRNAAFSLDEVHWRSPIPRPRFLFGLTGNSPKFWRGKGLPIPQYPIGFLRPWTCVRGHMETVTIPPIYREFRCASELGVVIAPGGRDIPREKAMDHVAGYTCVNDIVSNHWKDIYTQNAGSDPAFIDLCTSSFYGRATNGFAPVGPYITTTEEVGDPYGLLVYSRMLMASRSSMPVLRDRSHTDATIVAVDDAIAWLSRLVTLPPGAIIHMGTMGVDGYQVYPDQLLGPGDYVEVEFERVGVLRNPIDDRRSADEELSKNDSLTMSVGT